MRCDCDALQKPDQNHMNAAGAAPPLGKGASHVQRQPRLVRADGEAMTPPILEAFRRVLASRGFVGLKAPNGTMHFAEDYLLQTQPAELLEVLVARREKIFRSVPVVGQEAARKSYEDVVAAVDATKELIDMLVLP
jgi:hypothetical protein